MGSSPRSPSMSNLTCVYGFSASVGASCLCTLLLDLWGPVCKLRFFIEYLSHSLAGWDFGGLGEGDWHLLGHWGKGVWCHLDLSLPLEWECLLDSYCPTGVSSFSCLATSIPWGPAEGEQACEREQLRECHWPIEWGLADPTLLCRPALACSQHISPMHWSCCLWGSTLGVIAHPPVNLFCHLQDFCIRGP